MIEAAQAAILADCAESMYAPGVMAPPLDVRAAPDWTIAGYMTAADALLGAQTLGLGQTSYYGWLGKSKSNPLQWVAVIRGTENFLEWVLDGEGLPIPARIGKVHSGFWSIYESMRYNAGMLAAQGIAAVMPAGATLTIIGHSLGSALATYLMNDIACIPFGPGKDQRDFTVGGTLFASPRPGDGEFVLSADATIGALNYIAYAAVCDIVPHLPPALPIGGYRSMPATHWIKPSESQAIIARDLRCQHSALSYARALDYGSGLGTDSCVLGPTPGQAQS